ncbi:MAG: D-glycero-beta-D-manno-heptose-7-phosphate kinase [Ignavibacteriae bacterium HGW-Ignavibacteriae-2]|jgi:rfaE bifunctional protein kinase chain/domain|nr:MAG: D-glycero-beta-D-manno-heptose-7-phosphate kinase [Ignavibacteriae bacterium HGW-Ignavibacteriae-2]
MLHFEKNEILNLKSKFENKKIAVIGDMMLDGYYWGDVKRISPEAPVPVVEIEKEFFRFGGAANVILNIKSLGGIPYPIGIIGDDQEGTIFKRLLDEYDIDSSGLIVSTERPTTVKIRVIANKQHIVRIDKEVKDNINADLELQVIEKFNSILSELDAVILEDYNKGVLTEYVITESIKSANKENKIIAVDPKFINFFSYENVTVFKPNKKESEDAFNMRIVTDDDVKKVGSKLIQKLNAKHILITLGDQGLALFDSENKLLRIPTKARKVADVSGAGDTVIATLTMALASGINISDAAYLANFAGGLVCEEMGIVPINPDNLIAELLEELV